MPPRSLRGLKQLNRRAGNAIAQLERAVASAARARGSHRAWGQFLDGPAEERQVGIYGTTAAIRLLAQADGYGGVIRDALPTLPGLTQYDSAPTEGLGEEDLALSFKAAAILSAAQPGAATLQIEEPVERELIAACIEGRGWGYHHWQGHPDQIPNLLATAHIVIALTRSERFMSGPMAASVGRWLAEQLATDTQRPMFEQAFGLLALLRLERRANEIATFENARQAVLARMATWASHRGASAFDYDEHVHYWVPEGDAGHNHYGFFPPDVLVATALMQAGNPRPTRGYVLRVIQTVCKKVETTRTFESAATHRSGTTDALWTYELLREFRTTFRNRAGDLLQPAYGLVSLGTARRVVAVAVGLAVTIVLGVWAAVAADDKHIVLSSVVSAVGLAWVTAWVTLAISWTGKSD